MNIFIFIFTHKFNIRPTFEQTWKKINCACRNWAFKKKRKKIDAVALIKNYKHLKFLHICEEPFCLIFKPYCTKCLMMKPTDIVCVTIENSLYFSPNISTCSCSIFKHATFYVCMGTSFEHRLVYVLYEPILFVRI